MHQRQFLQWEGRGRVPEAAPRSGARQVLPGGGFSFLLPSSCFLRLCSQSHFQRTGRKTLHFSPRFSQGPDWRRGRGWKRGLRTALAAGLREQRLLSRPRALHVGGRWSAGLGRAGRRAGSPHTRTAAARRRLPTPWRGGCCSGFKGHGPQQLRRRRGRLQRLLLPLLHHSWAKMSEEVKRN